MGGLNKRQKKALAALRTTKTYIHQKSNSDDGARWYIFHPEYMSVRLSLTCKDVHQLNLCRDQFGHRKLS